MSTTGINKKKEVIIVDKPTEVNLELMQYLQQYENNTLKDSQNVKTNIVSKIYWKKKNNPRASTSNPFSITNLTKKQSKLKPSSNYDDKINNSSDSDTNTKNLVSNYNNNLYSSNKNLNSEEIKRSLKNEQKGLDDNYLNDFENKRKAKLGLLMIMNKYSGGEYCREIKKYFDNIKKAADERQLSRFMSELNSYNESEKVNKNFQRQNCHENLDVTDSSKFYSNKSKVNFSNFRVKKKLSNNVSMRNSDTDLSFNPKRSYGNFNFNKNSNTFKLPKIIEENNEFVLNKKEFANEPNEEQLAHFYYSIEELERLNNNIPTVSKEIKEKKEFMRNLLLNGNKQSSFAAATIVNNNMVIVRNHSPKNLLGSANNTNTNRNRDYNKNDNFNHSKTNNYFQNTTNSGSMSPQSRLKLYNNPRKSINLSLKSYNLKAKKLGTSNANQMHLRKEKKGKNSSFSSSN